MANCEKQMRTKSEADLSHLAGRITSTSKIQDPEKHQGTRIIGLGKTLKISLSLEALSLGRGLG